MLLLRPDFRDVVSVAQLVELWIVAPKVAGSNPVAHPNHPRKYESLIKKKHLKSSHELKAQIDTNFIRVNSWQRFWDVRLQMS
jgi:hypothetical protein